MLQANIKTEAYGYAIADATKAIELNPKLVKVRTPQLYSVSQPGAKSMTLLLTHAHPHRLTFAAPSPMLPS